MSKSFAARALALCLATMVTASVLIGVDLLAARLHPGVVLANGAVVTQPVLLASNAPSR